jgi:hypothetical protein
MTDSSKTEINRLRPDDVWHPHVGAPRGNRRAAKVLSTLERQVRALKRRAAAINRTTGERSGPAPGRQ